MQRRGLVLIIVAMILIVILAIIGVIFYEYFNSPDASFNSTENVSCYDGIKNGAEIGIDCGGSCRACVSFDCTPNCTGKNCGDDGCGGSCGSCESGECENGKCTAKTCADDCSAVGRFCDGNLTYTCSLGSDGCLDRVNGSECGWCKDGECVEIVECNNDNECEHGYKCVNNKCEFDCIEGENCFYG